MNAISRRRWFHLFGSMALWTASDGAAYGAQTSSDGPSIRLARGQRKPFYLPSLTVLLRVSPGPGRENAERHVDVRSVYLVTALRDLAEKDAVFTEFYESSQGSVQRWSGSHPEREEEKSGTSGHSFQVSFGSLREGSTTAVVTGAHFTYGLSTMKRYQIPGDTEQIPEGFTAWSYPNTDDYLGELRFVVESDDITLRNSPNGSRRRNSNGVVTAIDARTNIVSGAKTPTLTASWRDVVPGETMSLVFGW